MTEDQLRCRLATAQLALSDDDVTYLATASRSLETAIAVVRREARDIQPAGWDAATSWTATRP
ncbi:MAG: hypothetical protein FJX57_02490 [Alphaproteobacteria bacterium]|nr:hypothetical protein [Alphaproteobacteria bacterium]